MTYDRKVVKLLAIYEEDKSKSVVPETVDKIFNTKLSTLTKGYVDIPPDYDMTWNELSNFDGWTDLPAWIYNVAAVFEPTGILSWPAFVEALQDFEKEQSAWNSIFLILASLAIIPVAGKPMRLVWGFFKLLKTIVVKVFKFLPTGRLATRLLSGSSRWSRQNPNVFDNISRSVLPKLNELHTASGKKASQVYISFLRVNKLLPEESIRNLEKLIKQSSKASEKAAKSAEEAKLAKVSKTETDTSKQLKAAKAADDAVKAKEASKALKTSKELKDAEKALKKLDDAKKIKAASKIPSKTAKTGAALGTVAAVGRIGNALKDPLGREIDWHSEKGQELIKTLQDLAAKSKEKPTLMRRPGFPVGRIGDIRSGGSF
jgi:hypothetical protein